MSTKIYIYGGALYCEEHAPKEAEELNHTECEGDCPDHCDTCGKFLENPLTDDGYDYVCERITDYLSGNTAHSNLEVLQQWFQFYELKVRKPEYLKCISRVTSATQLTGVSKMCVWYFIYPHGGWGIAVPTFNVVDEGHYWVDWDTFSLTESVLAHMFMEYDT